MRTSRYSEPEWLVAIEARGWHALFSTGGQPGRKFQQVPVVAWTDDGQALVVDKKRGCLELATANGAFVRLTRTSDLDRELGPGRRDASSPPTEADAPSVPAEEAAA